jgi:hypothetical protein
MQDVEENNKRYQENPQLYRTRQELKRSEITKQIKNNKNYINEHIFGL